MAKVFANDMVAHVWAQMTQDEGRSHNGNFSFEGNTLYSYSTPIAQIHRTPGGPVVLLTDRSFSMTTNGKHKNAVWRATGYGETMPIFEVPFIGAWGGQAISSDRMSTDAERHAANLAYLVQQHVDAVAKLKRTREVWGAISELLERTGRPAFDYAATFGLPAPALDLTQDTADIEAHRAAREARNADPAYQAKRQREAERRETRKAEKDAREQAERAERERDQREAWLAGANNWYRGRSAHGGAMLRVRGEALETSQGASVPLAHAVKAFRFVKLCRERGEAWARNGHTIRVGHFQVDRIAPNGDFHAGCHFIEWSECERVARQLGVFDEAGSSEAVEDSAELAHA